MRIEVLEGNNCIWGRISLFDEEAVEGWKCFEHCRWFIRGWELQAPISSCEDFENNDEE